MSLVNFVLFLFFSTFFAELLPEEELPEAFPDPFDDTIPQEFQVVLAERQLDPEKDFSTVIGEDVLAFLNKEQFEEGEEGVLNITVPEDVLDKFDAEDQPDDPVYVSESETFYDVVSENEDNSEIFEQEIQVTEQYWAEIIEFLNANNVESENAPCEDEECAQDEDPLEVAEYAESLAGQDPRRLFIFPPDNRREYVGNPITGIPQRYAGRITFQNRAGRRFSCSGVLIRPRCVLTAGHCVHGGRGGTWYRNIRFWPRQNRNDGSSAFSWRRIRTWRQWTRRSNFNYDLAMIELRRVPPGVGRMAFGWSRRLRRGRFISTRGYPGDKPRQAPLFNRQMWDAPGSISALRTHQIRSTTCDVVPGNSGGMCYAWERIRGRSVPVTYGVWSHEARRWWFGWRRWNAAARITRSKFRIIRNFCPRS